MESALEKTTKCMGMGKGLHHCNSLHDVGGCGEGTVLCAQGTSSCCRIRECLRVCICARDRRCMCDVFCVRTCVHMPRLVHVSVRVTFTYTKLQKSKYTNTAQRDDTYLDRSRR